MATTKLIGTTRVDPWLIPIRIRATYAVTMDDSGSRQPHALRVA
jgi:hypothetical protein